MYVYATCAMTATVGFCSFGVDLGRAQLAKTELQRAVDAAARYAALTLMSEGSDAAVRAAVDTAAENNADGIPVKIDGREDVEFGHWDPQQQVFVKVHGIDRENARAVRVIARRTAKRGNPVPTPFASLLGRHNIDISATAVAQIGASPVNVSAIRATSNPFLAGMPPGTWASLNNPHNSPDRAPLNSPVLVPGLKLKGGMSLTFTSVNGGANNYFTSTLFSADGNTGWICTNTNGSEHGISNTTAPINALVGVFLDDNRPDQSPAPPELDFSTPQKRNFRKLEPRLKQIFFIGDALRDNGEMQEFVVPEGATRLYLATWDTFEWNNNIGAYSTTTYKLDSVHLVK